MSKISDDTICTNCGKPYEEHFHERSDDWVYCYEDTNGDFFTTEPTPEMIQEAEIARLREECELKQAEIEFMETRVQVDGCGFSTVTREELERLRKDAERYRYIRCGRRTTAIYEYFRGERLLKLEHELDAAIDAAKEAE